MGQVKGQEFVSTGIVDILNKVYMEELWLIFIEKYKIPEKLCGLRFYTMLMYIQRIDTKLNHLIWWFLSQKVALVIFILFSLG